MSRGKFFQARLNPFIALARIRHCKPSPSLTLHRQCRVSGDAEQLARQSEGKGVPFFALRFLITLQLEALIALSRGHTAVLPLDGCVTKARGGPDLDKQECSRHA